MPIRKVSDNAEVELEMCGGSCVLCIKTIWLFNFKNFPSNS